MADDGAEQTKEPEDRKGHDILSSGEAKLVNAVMTPQKLC